MKTVAFFNNKGGVGKTTLVYHLAWMFSDLGVPVIAADLDPQSNLTSAFLDEPELERIWPETGAHQSVFSAIEPLNEHTGDFQTPHCEAIDDHLGLVPGDLQLSLFEDRLAGAWSGCLEEKSKAADGYRVMTAFYRLLLKAAENRGAELVLIDVGPSLGALNRSALVAADYIVVPLGADLFSLQGLRNLGPTLRDWRSGWNNRVDRKNQPAGLAIPSGAMQPLGYVIMQPSMRQSRPVRAYQNWVDRIPATYAQYVMESSATPVAADPNCLATLRHFRSLMPMAQDAHKPMFALRPADGAIGNHAEAVMLCRGDFERLARAIAERIGVAVPAPLMAAVDRRQLHGTTPDTANPQKALTFVVE